MPSGPAGTDAADAAVGIDEEVLGGSLVGAGDSEPFEPPEEKVDKALATGLRAAAVAGGVRIAGLPFEAEVGQPVGRLTGVVAEGADEVLVGAAAGNAHQVAEHVVGGVVADAELVLLVGEPHLGIGEAGVATALGPGRLFDEDGIATVFVDGKCRRKAGDTTADDHDIELVRLRSAGRTEGNRHGAAVYGWSRKTAVESVVSITKSEGSREC